MGEVMPSIILTTGLPGSGKSTWAVATQNRDPEQIILVSRDDIRKMIGCFPIGNKDQENLVSKIQDGVIVSGIKAGKDVIVHDTNLNSKSPTRIKKLFDGDVLFSIADFTDVPVDVCIERDAQRDNPVGSTVIKNMARQLEKPWRLTAEFMNDVTLSPLYVPDQSKPLAIVYDLDGTVARHDHRSPYDYSRLDTDGLHMEIADIISKYSNYDGYFALALSGRPDVSNNRVQTLDWLSRKNVPCDHLFMRPADMLKDNDADVKQFLFDTHIRDNFNVEFWLDDRDRVVRRMRKLGIKVLQVAEGDF
jgi:predicted kinase